MAIINFSSETAKTTTNAKERKETCIKILLIMNIFLCILKMERNLINALGEPEQSNAFWFLAGRQIYLILSHITNQSAVATYNNDRNLVCLVSAFFSSKITTCLA